MNGHDFPKKDTPEKDAEQTDFVLTNGGEANTDRSGQIDGSKTREGGKAIPYGIYDVCANVGWVGVGITHDTAEFAVNSIQGWYDQMGVERYPEAERLLVTADCGGSNGVRVRLWKRELQRLADETGRTIEVCHYPSGTSKWNKIEHLSHFAKLERASAHQQDGRWDVATTTKTGLVVRAQLDPTVYEKRRKVSDAEMATINITKDEFHPEWNYVIAPRRAK